MFIKKALLCFLVVTLVACGDAPVFKRSEEGSKWILLGADYNGLLLQIYEKGIDATWDLDIENTSIIINGKRNYLLNAKRHKYITKQNGFAYTIYLKDQDLVEGIYKIDVTLIKDGVSRKFNEEYSVELKEISYLPFISFYEYMYAVYKQRTE